MNTVTMILPWILIFGVMYFFMLRPQIKKQKEQKLNKKVKIKDYSRME